MKPHYKKITIVVTIACILGVGALFVLIPKDKYEGVKLDDAPFYSTPWGKINHLHQVR